MIRKLALLILLYASVLLALRYAYQQNYIDYALVSGFIEEHRALAMLIYCVSFITGMIMILPMGLPMLFVAGWAWGIWLGTLVATTATTIAAIIAFSIARYMLRHGRVQRLRDRYPLLASVPSLKHQIKYIALTTINPLIPQTLLNYAYGLSTMPLKKFAVSMYLVSLPINFLYIAMSEGLRSFVMSGNMRQVILLLGAGMFALTFACMFWDAKKWKRKKSEATPAE